jgi:hydroxyacylglutathione hydrolase
MLAVHAIPAFSDNYLWLLVRGHDAVVVDPGDAAPVRAFLDAHGLRLRAILITHHHPDHTAGIAALAAPDIPVYGPAAEASRIAGLTDTVREGDRVRLLELEFEVLELPGHTLGHIAYHTPGRLFCGDTLFAAGCGRLFEGSPQQMHHSLQRLAALPPETLVYCTHEYTLSNLAFALAVEPHNPALLAQIAAVKKLRAADTPSLPSRIATELATNPFLRTSVAAVRQSAELWAGQPLVESDAVFAALRRWKDGYKGSLP